MNDELSLKETIIVLILFSLLVLGAIKVIEILIWLSEVMK